MIFRSKYYPTYTFMKKALKKNGIALFLLLLLFGKQTFAQNPRLQFFNREVGIGEDVQVSITFSHSYKLDVFFPTNKALFAPFELKNKSFYPTITKDTISTDSMIYILRVFDIEKIQKLALPVRLMLNKDSLTYWSNSDSIILKEFIPDSTLKSATMDSATGFLKQKLNQNLSVPLKITLVSLLLFGLLTLVFRNKIIKYVEFLRFQKRHADFVSNFKKLMRSEENTDTLQKVISLWRERMANLEGKPYDTLSSVEIEKESGQNVGQALREIESSLFGSQKSERIPIALQILFDKAREIYSIRKKLFRTQLKNTK
jgi:hypothetical protein